MELETQLSDLTRGAVDIISLDSLKSKLQSNDRLKIKFGIDPTAPDIHFGHTVPLQKLRTFQKYGHDINLVIGDFTAKIGDPTGKSATRPTLSNEEIKHNLETYTSQVFKILDESRTKLFYNNDW